MSSLFVYMNGHEVGEYIRQKSGAEEFHYSENWLARPRPIPLSRSLPLTEKIHKGNVVINYFDNLLPDSIDIRQRIQARFKVKTNRAFDLLAAIGRDCVGAIQLLSEKTEVNIRKIQGTPLTNEEIGHELKNCRTHPLGMSGGEESFRISIAGVQEKTALLRYNGQWHRPAGTTPTTHILKLPIGKIETHNIDLSDSVENEFFCLHLLRAFDLPAPDISIEQFGDLKTLAVKRFDRSYAPDGSWIIRLPQEDVCQALGFSPALKYEKDGGPGIAAVMSLLSASAKPIQDRFQFMKSVYLFWVLGAIDGHAKNFSIFLHPHGQFKLTPLYDVISAYPLAVTRQIDKRKLCMAMLLHSKNNHSRWWNIMPRHWFAMAEKVNFPQEQMSVIIDEIRETACQAVDKAVACLPAGFPETISVPIINGINEAVTRVGSKQGNTPASGHHQCRQSGGR